MTRVLPFHRHADTLYSLEQLQRARHTVLQNQYETWTVIQRATERKHNATLLWLTIPVMSVAALVAAVWGR